MFCVTAVCLSIITIIVGVEEREGERLELFNAGAQLQAVCSTGTMRVNPTGSTAAGFQMNRYRDVTARR